MRLLLVEDDINLSRQLKTELVHLGFAVDVAYNGTDAEHLGLHEPYDLVILDLGLPLKSGLDVLKAWRAAKNKVPVLVLTARDAWHEKVDGFKAGADDYLGKPFHTEELVARVNALIRRSHAQPSGITVAGLILDEERQTVSTASGETFSLTGTEFRLLRYLMLNPGKIISKSRLAEHVYEYDGEKDSNVIEVYIKRLRQKLGKSLIDTRRGQGYVLNSNDDS